MVMFLHGLGANGQDLINIAQYWQNALPDTMFVSPDAPFACDMAPGMMNSYQWFSLQDRDPHVMLQGVEQAAPILNSYIDNMLQEFDLKEDKLALVGFSQGTMMSLYAGARRDKTTRRDFGVFRCDDRGYQRSQNQTTHSSDPWRSGRALSPMAAYQHARGALIGAGFTVSGHTTPGLEHGIDNDGIESGVGFLQRTLK